VPWILAAEASGAMPVAEPLATAVFLATVGILLAVSVLFSRATERFSLPVALLFLVIGMLAGSEGIGGIAFENYGFAFRLGTAALVFILFDGGLNTSLSAVREVIRPAGVLATAGVIGTAAVTGLAAHLLGFDWPAALLLGAIVSSTDAAAVFAVLRGSGVNLKRRVGSTLEVESGVNDPMAVILSMSLAHGLTRPGSLSVWSLAIDVIVQMVVGGVLGYLIGAAARWLIARVRLPASGFYPVLTIAVALLAFALPTLASGSGFLAVYIVALMLGNAPLPYRAGLARVHDALAWLSQVAMFLMFGILSFPSRLIDVAVTGLALGLILAFIARPVVVALCLLPFRFPRREVSYIGWVGLRGAVPIILATFPVLINAPGAKRIFDVVFFIVVLNAFLPGATVPWITRRLGLEARVAPKPPAVLEIESLQPLGGELMSFYIDEALAVAGVPLADLPFPQGASVLLIEHGRELIAPRGDTVLQPGDHVYVFAEEHAREVVHLLFGSELE